jgi:hypothetical protein
MTDGRQSDGHGYPDKHDSQRFLIAIPFHFLSLVD